MQEQVRALAQVREEEQVLVPVQARVQEQLRALAQVQEQEQVVLVVLTLARASARLGRQVIF